MMRIINYKIDDNWIGKSVHAFLKNEGYPEHALSHLRKEHGLLAYNELPVHMNFSFPEKDKGRELKVYIKESSYSENIKPINLPFEIIYEDEDVIVVNKPAGMPIHPSLNNQENTLANALKYYYVNQGKDIVFRCINRLDKDTTGLTIIAKNYVAAGILNEKMKRREIHREYTAIVEGTDIPDSGRIELPIGREDKSMIKRIIDYENGEKAVTNYKVIERNYENNTVTVKLNLETGRTHQIRVHMKAIGHPLIGDYIYNPENKMLNRQALHAGKIEFIHPITHKKAVFEVPIPNDMCIN